MNRAVFLDRDGTILNDPGYLSDPAQVELLEGAGEAIRLLNEAGFRVVVVTNQSGIARGMLTEDRLSEIHDEMRRQLRDFGATVDAIYYCPYHVKGVVPQYTRASNLRKPAPGMLLQAAGEMSLDLSASWMVGDKPDDVAAGKRSGCKTIRIEFSDTADSTHAEDGLLYTPDAHVGSLLEATEYILDQNTVHNVPKVEDVAVAAPEPVTLFNQPADEPAEDAPEPIEDVPAEEFPVEPQAAELPPEALLGQSDDENDSDDSEEPEESLDPDDLAGDDEIDDEDDQLDDDYDETVEEDVEDDDEPDDDDEEEEEVDEEEVEVEDEEDVDEPAMSARPEAPTTDLPHAKATVVPRLTAKPLTEPKMHFETDPTMHTPSALNGESSSFDIPRFIGGLAQMFAVMFLILAGVKYFSDAPAPHMDAIFRILVAILFQGMSLTFYVMSSRD